MVRSGLAGVLTLLALQSFGSLAFSGSAEAAAVPVMKPAVGAEIVRFSPALDAVVAPGAGIEKMATGFVFIEGPMWHNGGLWFSDLRGNKMYRLTADGKLTVQLNQAGGLPDDQVIGKGNKGSNAMVTDKDGTVLMEQHGARRIVRLGPDMKPTVFLDKANGQRFNSPNDMVFAADGALWITDPPYGFFDPAKPNADLDKDPAKETKADGVYRYKDGKIAVAIADLPRPNGIGFSPDGKTLYISNTEPTGYLLRYDVGPNGALSNRQVFLDLSKAPGDGVPDGLKVDTQGNLWATGPGGIRIISPAGKVLGQIHLPEVAANIAFGGSDHKFVYIMGSTSVYRLPILIPGEKPLYEK